MGELEDLKSELAGLQSEKINAQEIEALKKQIKDAKATIKPKKKDGAVKAFFRPRGNEKQVMDFLLGVK